MKRWAIWPVAAALVATTAWSDVSVQTKAAGAFPERITEIPFYGPDKTGDSFVSGERLHWIVREINSWAYRDLIQLFAIADAHGIRHLVVHLNSGGGSVFDGMALGMLIREKVRQGWTMEIRAQGFVASAAVIVLVSGSPGERFLHDDSIVMVHEISTFAFLEKQETKDAKKKAERMQFIQDTMTGFVARYTRISPDELAKLMYDETWMTATNAVLKGFADQLIRH